MMSLLKLVQSNVFLNTGIKLQGNKSKMRIIDYLKRPVSRFYSTQGVERAVPKIQKPSMRVSKVGKEIDLTALLLLCIPLATFSLGTWQVKRKKWKENLIEELMRKTTAPAIQLPSDESKLDELEYRRVSVKGVFDHSGEMYLGPRSLLEDGESKSGGKLISSSASETSGYYVITPFILSDTKERILVNRGWVPFTKKNPKTRLEGQVEGEVEFEGIVRKTEPRQPFVPDDKLNVKVFLTRNVEKMATLADTKPVFIDAVAESSAPGGPIGGQTRASLRNEHLSYIITWYSLSAATGAMWYIKYLKKPV